LICGYGVVVTAKEDAAVTPIPRNFELWSIEPSQGVVNVIVKKRGK
jgi:hypothetical protein